MHEEASFFLSKDASRRPYIHALDKLYSNYDCTPFSEKLYEIETKLFNDSYADQNSFKQDLLKINALTKDVIDTLIGNRYDDNVVLIDLVLITVLLVSTFYATRQWRKVVSCLFILQFNFEKIGIKRLAFKTSSNCE